MFVVTFANPKGGTGKTTSCLILAEQLYLQKVRVGLIDADPNENLVAWCKGREREGRFQPFVIDGKPTEDGVFDAIDAMQDKCDFLLIDLEGVADMRFANATMASDLVVIPLQPSPMENRQAARTTKMLRDASRRARRDIPHGILLNQLNPGFQTAEERALREEIEGQGVQLLAAGLQRREIFKTIFGEGLMLHEIRAEVEKTVELSPRQKQQRLKSVDGAVENAKALYAAFARMIEGATNDKAA